MTLFTAFGPDIWLCDGPVVDGAMGFHFPTRMVVIRLASGGLFIWSPVALSEDLKVELRAIGPVGHVVAPNTLHHVFLAFWQQTYPDARYHAAPGLRAKRPDLRIDEDLGPAPPAAWAGQIDQVIFTDNALATEVVFFHRASGTAIFTDLLQQMPRTWFRGWRGLVARLDLMTGDRPEVPRKFRLAFRDRAAARAALGAVLRWPVERLVFAHGRPSAVGGRDAIADAFRWLG